MNKLLGALALVLVLAAGWWLYTQRGADTPGLPMAVETDASAASLLEFIPAESAYVAAPLQALPEDLARSLLAQAEPILAALPSLLSDWRTALDESADQDAAQQMRGVLDALEAEFKGKSLEQSIAHVGMAPNGLVALYAIDLVPVARVRLDSAQRMREFFERMQTAAGSPLQRSEFEGHSLWTLPAEQLAEAPLKPLIALVDQDLVISMVPVADAGPLTRRMLGLDKPANSLAASGELARRATELGFLPYIVGYLDNARLLSQASKPSGETARGFLEALKQSPPELAEICHTELAQVAGNFPGASFGYTRLDGDGNVARMVWHVEETIAGELLKLRAAMPGGPEVGEDALFAFGVALSLKELPGVVGRLAARISAAPYACKELAFLNQAATDAGKGINNPAVFAAGPMAFGLQLVIDDFSLSADGQTPNGSGMLLLGSDNPQSLIGMAKGFVPQLAQLQVPTDGKAVALPTMPGSPPGLPPTFIAQSEKVLAISIGEPEEARLAKRLRLDPAWQPVISSSASGRVYEVIGRAIETAIADMPDNAEKRELSAQARIMIETQSRLFSRSDFVLEFSQRGIELEQATLTD